jgi:hypothetical protein
MHDDYRSASCDDVARMVDVQMKLRTQVEQLNTKVAMLREALIKVHSIVCGDQHPHWSDEWQTTQTRGHIADITEFSSAATEEDVQRFINIIKDESARDAARYRYLRSQVNNDEGTPMAQVVWKLHWIRESSNWTNLVDGNNLDEHCDRALRDE